MDIRQMLYFITIAEEGSITAAAKKLHISQPPLSQQLISLENELGIKLFERHPRNVQLTDAGRLFLIKAKHIVELTMDTKKELGDFSQGFQGTLNIGVTPTFSAIMNHTLSDFLKDYPNINFRIHEGNTFEILDLVNNGIVDIGIVRTPYNENGLDSIVKPPEPMIATMTSDFDLGMNISIEIEALSNKKLIIYSRYELLIRNIMEKHQMQAHFFCISDRSSTALHLAEAGLGIAIIPYSAIHMINNKNLIYKIIEEDDLYTCMAIIWSKQHYLRKPAQKILQYF